MSKSYLEALYNLYQQLIEDPDSGVAPLNYSEELVSHEAVVDEDGNLIALIDLRDTNENGKLVARTMLLPQPPIRSNNILPCFAYDRSAYVFGIQKNPENPERLRQCFDAFSDFNLRLLKDADDAAARAFCKFLTKREFGVGESPVLKAYADGLASSKNIVFRLKGDDRRLHERQAVRDAWQAYKNQTESSVRAQCLVTGKTAAISRLHPFIKGIPNAHESGASFINFNDESFEYMGKTQGENAPVSEEAALACAAAAQWLIKQERHRVYLGDMVLLYWAEQKANLEESLLDIALNGGSQYQEENAEREANEPPSEIHQDTVKLLRDVFRRAASGLPLSEENIKINENVTFYFLGLSANVKRIVVRVWQQNSFGSIIRRLAQYHKDIDVGGKPFDKPPSVWSILGAVAPQRDTKKLPSNMSGKLLDAVLFGKPYPFNLYTNALERVRRGSEKVKDKSVSAVTKLRVGVINAYLIRHSSEVNKLDNTAKQCGKLFAVLEKAQQDAAPGINKTIRDKFFRSAMTRPNTIFPLLISLAQSHISKLDWGVMYVKLIQEILSPVKAFPAYLNIYEQGQFILGYYHQREALYQKRSEQTNLEEE